MGANLTKEYPSTWEEEGVKKWRESAVQVIKSYYLSFRGSQFDEYMIDEDEKLLLAKICFSIYGPPTVKEAKEIWDGYEESQLENANEILKLILEVHKEQNSSSKRLLVGIIVIACKQEEAEYVLPIFSIFTGYDPCNPHAARYYVDTQRRIYKSWEDWKANNTMPMLKYAFPRRGFFTCSNSCEYQFDADKDPDVEFATSPACDLSSRIFGTTDTVAAVTSLTCGVIGVISMLTPVGPAVLLTTAITGSSSALYGTSRAVVRLYDKGTHGGSLTDLESFTLWFSIAATPLHFTTSIVNGALVRGAVVNGRIFSSSMRMFATVLNFSTLGVDGVMIAFGIANLIDKYKQDQLQPLDVLQFSMSVFFFTNTLIQPKMASTIIKNAQDSHIQAYANNMSDKDAQAAFNKFLETNKGDGSIKDTSKIIRSINRINNPDKLFGDLKTADVKIGGRRGRTLLVTSENNREFRINPQRVTFTTTAQGVNVVNYKDNIKKLFKRTNLKDAEINGNKIFENLNDRQKARVNKAIGGAAGTNETIVKTAIAMSKEMGLNSTDDVLSVVEIISAQLKSDHKNLKMKDFNASHLQSINTKSFMDSIKADLKIATQIANKNNLKFENPLLAVYHYRKHGAEFAEVVANSKIEVYLKTVPQNLIDYGNLVGIEDVQNSDGTFFVRKTYTTPQDQFAVVIEGLDQKTISTMFQKSGAYESYRKACPATPNWNWWHVIGDVSNQFTQTMGFRGFYSYILNFDEPEERIEIMNEEEDEE